MFKLGNERIPKRNLILFAGAKIAQYAGKHLHKFVVKQPKYAEGKYEKALKQAFLDIDMAMLNDKNLKDELSGSTAIVCLLKANQLYVVSQV